MAEVTGSDRISSFWDESALNIPGAKVIMKEMLESKWLAHVFRRDLPDVKRRYQEQLFEEMD